MSNRIVKGGGFFLPPGCEEAEKIKDRYKVENPAHAMAHSLRGRGKWVNIPDPFVYACHDLPPGHAWASGTAIPRGIDVSRMPFDVVDKETCPPAKKLRLNRTFKMRDYQEKAVEELVKQCQGAVIAPCGAGKTSIGIGAIAAIPTKALILVHTIDLAEQWIQRCESILGEKPSLIGGGSNQPPGRITVTLFQTLSTRRWEERYEWAKQFGLVIADECHHLPAETFASVMMTMPAKYRLGLTATPDRPDGLEKILWWHLGNKLAEITVEEMIDRKLVMAPSIEWLTTNWDGPGKNVDWSKLIKAMTQSQGRNQVILDRAKDLVSEGRQVLILSDRVAHCQSLAEELREFGISSEALVGKLTKAKRNELLREANEGSIRVITATTIADEGLDLPGLDTVILTTPTKAMGRVQQRIGRVMRTKEGKRTPLVVDLLDEPGALRGLARKRYRLYAKLGCRT